MDRGFGARAALLGALLATSAGFAPAARAAANCEAASCVPDFWSRGQIAGGVGPDFYAAAQVFVPGFTGALDQVLLGLWSTTPGSVIVEIRTVQDGVPTATLLATATMPSGPYSDDVLHAARFEGARPVLTRGTPYALVTRARNTPPIQVLGAFPACRLALTGSSHFADSYDGGTTWRAAPPQERSFVYRVCLDAATPARPHTWGALKLLYR
jgi:hypothetical protein